MRVVIQRSGPAKVEVDGVVRGQITSGLVVFLGVAPNDGKADVDWLIQKICSLRIFSDPEGRMNLSVVDVQASIMVISQFTLFASTKKGNRPGFTNSAPPELAKTLYDYFIHELRQQRELNVACGIFGANMHVSLVNEGPVTILIDTKNKE